MKPKSAIVWKLMQLWLKARCRLRRGHPLPYELRPGVRFVAHLHDVSSHDIYIKRTYENVELDWCARWLQDGDSLVDCGANIGYYSACLSQMRNLQKVLAVEGNETCSQRCADAFEVLGLSSIELVSAILHSDESKALHIPDKPGMEGLQHVEEPDDGHAALRTITLDNLVKAKALTPSLVKIDCEGAEIEILKGAQHLLEKVRPAWLVEVNDDALIRAGAHRNQLFDIFRTTGYKTFHVASAFADVPFGVEIDEGLQSWSFNLAAIPNDEENLQRWKQTRPQS